jgi:hypothetical protein
MHRYKKVTELADSPSSLGLLLPSLIPLFSDAQFRASTLREGHGWLVPFSDDEDVGESGGEGSLKDVLDVHLGGTVRQERSAQSLSCMARKSRAGGGRTRIGGKEEGNARCRSHRGVAPCGR